MAKPSYELLDQLLDKKLDRRSFIIRLGALGVATPAVLAYIEACSNGATPTTTGGKVTLTPPGKLPSGEAAKRPLIFNAWDFKPDVVRQFMQTFDSSYNESVNFSVIPGDFTSVMLNKLLSRAPLDYLYTQDNAVKFFNGGWIQDLSGLNNLNEIKQQTLPVQWTVQSYNGAILGLPYFNSAKGVVATNEIALAKAGLTGQYPKTHTELYAQVRQLKKDGVAQYPLIPHWVPLDYGITQMWAGEAICRGDKMWADDLSATFDTSTAAAQVLEDWRALYQDQVVPPASLTWQDSDRLDAFGTGKYVYCVLNGYNIYDVNQPAQSAIAGHVMAIPYAGEPWGFLDYAFYSVARKDASNADNKRVLDRAAQLVEFMGYKDNTGNFAVAKAWMEQAFLGTGYPALWNDPEVITALTKWMPDIKLKTIFQAHYDNAVAISGWKAIWYPDFNAAARPLLAKAILGQETVPNTIKALKDSWSGLQATYK
ncbi:MAG: ABC transporter substrate-binding protein [Candidatus Dormibacteraceae bacterium]